MAQQLKVSKLDERVVNTRFGSKGQWVVNGKWSAFKGSWNSGWKVGDTIKGVFKQNESNGKTYFNIECPPELKQQGGGMQSDVLNKILNELVIIRNTLQKNDGQGEVEVEPAEQPSEQPAEQPVDEPTSDATDGEINTNDIFF